MGTYPLLPSLYNLIFINFCILVYVLPVFILLRGKYSIHAYIFVIDLCSCYVGIQLLWGFFFVYVLNCYKFSSLFEHMLFRFKFLR